MMAQKDDTEKPDFEALYGEDERNLNRKTQEELGITNKKLARQLKAELQAKETKVIKIKGAVKQEDLPRGFKVIATSSYLSYTKEGYEIYGDGETIIRYDVIAHNIRQNARKDAEAQRGHYPTETDMRHFGEVTLKVVYDHKPNGNGEENGA